MHVDDSDVTFNVCLGDGFTGAHITATSRNLNPRLLLLILLLLLPLLLLLSGATLTFCGMFTGSRR